MAAMPNQASADRLWSLSLGQSGTFSDTGLSSAAPQQFGFKLDPGQSYQLLLGRFYEQIEQDYTNIELFIASQRSNIQTKNTATQTTRNSELDSLHIQAGGSYQFAYAKNIRPFIGMALGGSRFTSKDYDALNRVSFSFNAGVSFDLGQAVALRLDTRALGIVLDSRTEIFCAGGCVAKVTGNLWMQYSAAAALEFRF
ncbi:MAG: porin family protein [Gammaproteobacteria bacterium]|nr:porin family protein [Gammaproteobacteria bacterium]MBT8149780.1 porin family protein [Gammaproteobacteria bacterium]NND39786.1 outer membrane beta-barrel protein [Pseudomonadales bacterium]NNM10814.1 outer membrane beta-barrel protein [Pseudomonadales bacterium]RZV58808.1 MAG: hypothetical protein EX270_02430 [Pseudomonadales bacterium]